MTTLDATKKNLKSEKTVDSSEVKQTEAGKLTPVKTSQPNEGEGNRTAARNYDNAVEAYAESGRSESAAKAAASALEGPEGDDLRAAEEFAKKGQPKGKSTS